MRFAPCRAEDQDTPPDPNVVDHTAHGHVATVVSGEVIAENGVPTSARTGKLVRGIQSAPARPVTLVR